MKGPTKGVSARCWPTLRKYAAIHGVNKNTVKLAGGVEKLQKLSPEVQRLLLGVSK